MMLVGVLGVIEVVGSGGDGIDDVNGQDSCGDRGGNGKGIDKHRPVTDRSMTCKKTRQGSGRCGGCGAAKLGHLAAALISKIFNN